MSDGGSIAPGGAKDDEEVKKEERKPKGQMHKVNKDDDKRLEWDVINDYSIISLRALIHKMEENAGQKTSNI